MKDIRSYLLNYTPASSGYSFGKLKDNPGDDTGSAVTEKWANDLMYAFYAFINKYGTVSDTDESESASDFVDAVEAAFSDLAVLLTGAQTVAGVKTFSSTIVGSINSIKETGSAGATYRKKEIPIGDWNMDSTDYVDVAHGLTNSKIRSITACVRTDDEGSPEPLNRGKNATDTTPQGFCIVVYTNIRLFRLTGGHFDSTSYNATSFNRGYITIEYVD
ncbi:MAG TPA: hypothetical protein PK573_12020 [Spirochaetota bacterium]|nr:hypothetical protein [Spirochaetota bacterium]HRZ26620.1 hypothetical protein [Spirochaetota bacterium]